MRPTFFVLLLLALLHGCGGGGGGSIALEPLAPASVALGLVPGNAPTTFSVTVVNRFAGTARVVEPGHDPGFSVAPGQLPLDLAAGAQAELEIVLTPWRLGLLTGDVVFALEAGTQSDAQVTEVSATAEAAAVSVAPSALDFGEVLPGDTADLAVQVTNDSLVSTVSLGTPTLPGAAFSLTASPLPTSLPPGQTLELAVRYAPADVGPASGFLTVPSDAGSGPLLVSLAGTSSGEQLVDLGTVSFLGNGDTQELQFEVPDDAISFMIQAITAPGTELGLRLLTGPGNKVYENEILTGPYIWSAQEQVFNQQVPNTDRTDVQLVAGGGTYKFKLLRWSGSASSCDVQVLIERRPNPATRGLATLDLNVFLAQAIAPTAATAAADTTLQTVLGQMDTILSQQGVRLGDIDYYDVSDSTYDDVTWGEFGSLLQLSAAATKTRLNLFFVRTAIGGGVLGVSATLGGPVLNGTPVSGVMSLYSTGNPAFIGLVAAHEVGHYLGLAHTVEEAGTHDDITDTAECPPTQPGGTFPCDTLGGGYLMHWQAVGGTNVTDGQGLVIRGHPHMTPRSPDGGLLQAKPAAPAAVDVPPDVPSNWCGTCQCLHRTVVK